MKTDVFRFNLSRAPQAPKRLDDTLIVGVDDDTPSAIISQLERDREEADGLARMTATAAAFVQERSNGDRSYVTRLADLDPRLSQLEQLDTRSEAFVEAVQAVAVNLAEPELIAWKRRVTDSLVVALVLRTQLRANAAPLDKALRLLGLLEDARAKKINSVRSAEVSLKRIVVLPRSIFPLPPSNAQIESIKARHKERLVEEKLARERQAELVKRIAENQAAIKELTKIYDLDLVNLAIRQGEERVIEPPPPRGPFRGLFDRLSRSRARDTELTRSLGTQYAVIDRHLADQLSESTKSVIAREGRSVEALNVPDVVTQLERDVASLSRTLYVGGKTGRAVLLADGYIVGEDPDSGPVGNLVGGPPGDGLFGGFDTHVPGVCLSEGSEDPLIDESSVPTGMGTFQSLGVSDLLVVKQSLLRYEMGEVAHIENVMASESRSRTHRSLTRTETFTLVETETSEESERDLQTTERFELQSETEKTIQEDASRHAGVTVSGSHGIGIEFSANASFTGNTSQSNATRAATSHAREIVDRSVHRIQERVRRERSTLTINEVEVINEHGFDNQGADPAHISGVYRWVDKVYEAQVYNYGKRELIELVIPEPAALLRHFNTSAPKEGLTLERPREPGYCGRRGVFEPLEPKHINRVSYLFWSARYNVRDVRPPPPRYLVIGVAISRDSDADNALALADNSLKVPPGYVAKKGVHNAAGPQRKSTDPQDVALIVLVGRHRLEKDDKGAVFALDNESGTVPIAMASANLGVFGATVEVECEVTDEAMDAWRLAAYNAIMQAYEEQRAEYEAELRRVAEFSEGGDFEGRNPLLNRETEKREIKRAAVSQMTGQHFDDFDAMRRAVAPHGYPQADVSEARAEGEYVRFLEQAFEWENMRYLFYPYFWTRKKTWPLLNQFADKDPIHEAFLQAGSCRVNIPVRPGFEAAVNAFLSTGVLPWNDDDPSVIDEEPFLSIADELRGQQGAVSVKAGGTVSVAAGSLEVTGTGTDFSDDDLNREITLGGDVYLIAEVTNPEVLRLKVRYDGPVLRDADYVIGAKASGVPWAVRIPTALVILQEDADLPSFEETIEAPTPGPGPGS